MTMLAAGHFGDHALLAADTRITWYPPGRPPFTTDGKVKIQPTGLGYIAGSGASQLIDAVAARIADQRIVDTRQITEIIEREYARFCNATGTNPAWTTDQELRIAATAWLLTYRAPQPDGQRLLRVVHVDAPTRTLHIAGPGGGMLIAPFDLPRECGDALGAAFNEGMRAAQECSSGRPLLERLTDEARLFAAPFFDIARRTSLISNDLHLAIDTLRGVLGIYEVRRGSRPDDVEVRLLEDVAPHIGGL